MKIQAGDKVVVLSGKNRGHEGEVVKAFPKSGRLIVEGVNVVKRHTKPTQAMQQGGILEKEMPIDASNVAIVSPTDGKPTKVGYQIDAQGIKTRVCRRTGAAL